MKFPFQTLNNKLNLVLIVLVLLSVGLGCDKLTGGSLENTSWKGTVTDPQSKMSFPINVDLLPDDKAYFTVTLPNTPQPIIGSAKWSKSDKRVNATWGSAEMMNTFDGKVDGDEINGTISNAKGSIPVTLTKQKK